MSLATTVDLIHTSRVMYAHTAHIALGLRASTVPVGTVRASKVRAGTPAQVPRSADRRVTAGTKKAPGRNRE
jgi:hypothetical protein